MRAFKRLHIVMRRHVAREAALFREALSAARELALERLLAGVGAHMASQSPLRFEEPATARKGALEHLGFPPFRVHVSLLLQIATLFLRQQLLRKRRNRCGGQL